MISKSNLKRIFLKVSPYLASLIAAILFYSIGLTLGSKIEDLFTNISAALFAIPLIYLFYQTAHNYSQKRLKKEILDYAKMQINQEVLSVLFQLQKIVYPYNKSESNLSFLSLKNSTIFENLSKNEYLGFQILKKWELAQDNLHEILKNPFILNNLENEHIICIISLIKNINRIENLQKNEKLYIKTGYKNELYQIARSNEISDHNKEFPDRYLLLKTIGNSESKVIDFGDFQLYNENELLENFIINPEILKTYSESIINLKMETLKWIKLINGEMILALL